MDKIHDTVAASLEPFHDQLLRVPTHEDREKLLNIPIRRISRFDLDKNQEEIAATESALAKIEKELKNIKKFTIAYLRGLITKYAKEYPRKTQIQALEQIDRRAVATRSMKVGYDPATGFIGTKVASENPFTCTNFDKLLILYKDGSYSVINIPEKQYIQKDNKKVVYTGVADKQTVMSVIYKDPKTHLCYAKRFIVDKFILDKVYNYFEPGMELMLFSVQPKVTVDVQLIPKPKQKVARLAYDMEQVRIKGVTAQGVRVSNRQVKKVVG
jgi:topoisomerase-4 subunit A